MRSSSRPKLSADLQSLFDAAAVDKDKSERTVERHLCNYLDYLSLHPRQAVSLKNATGQELDGKQVKQVKQLDILVEKRRLVIEVKASGGFNEEEQFPQLEGYVHWLFNEFSLRNVGLLSNRWLGILTDGRKYKAWAWDSKTDCKSLGGIAFDNKNENEKPKKKLEAIRAWIDNLIYRESYDGKPWMGTDNMPCLFQGYRKGLRCRFDEVAQKTDVKTKFSLWRDLITASGMLPPEESEQKDLFFRHSFLVLIAKAVIGALTADPSDNSPTDKGVLDDGFAAWIIEDRRALKIANEVFEEAARWDWRMRRGDVLREFYQQIIPKEQRKAYGEYYTPDWLAAQLAEEILDTAWIERSARQVFENDAHPNAAPIRGIGVLDPACGSGTFLYHAARRILDSAPLRARSPAEQAKFTARLVHGVDIHPVAVEMAKATLLRALPVNPGVDNLRIYQGDSLLIDRAPTEDHQKGKRKATGKLDFGDTGDLEFKSPEGAYFSIPARIVEHNDFAGIARRLVQAAVKADSPQWPSALENLSGGRLTRKLNAACTALTEICKKEGNHVWAWYITNSLAPVRLSKHKVNRILANPPWVVMKDIQVQKRKEEMIKLASQMSLWPGGRNAPKFDTAALFIHRCRQLYLDRSQPVQSAWVVNQASMRTDTWAKHRAMAEPRWTKIHDYGNFKESPFHGANSCAWIELAREHPKAPVQCRVELKGARVTRNADWHQFKDLVVFTRVRVFKQKPSEYVDTFRRGATMVPHCLVRLDPTFKGQAGKQGEVGVRTVRSRHAPWNTFAPAEGDIPARWKVPFTIDGYYPFGVSQDYIDYICPLGEDGLLLSEERAQKNNFWRGLNTDYEENASAGKNTPRTLLTRINYSQNLARQFPLCPGKKVRVVYNCSGGLLRAARTDQSMGLDASSYYRCFGPDQEDLTVKKDAVFEEAVFEEEAAYLTAVLNASALLKAFNAARRSDRHYALHIWRSVPIPRYSASKKSHKVLAGLCLEAEELVSRLLPELRGQGQIKVSKQVRAALQEAGISRKIDAQVRRILPDWV